VRKCFEFLKVEVILVSILESHLYREGPKNGVVFLWDMEGVRIGHVFQPKLTSIRKLINLVDDACPFKIREIHVLNTQPFLDLVLGRFACGLLALK
jgi:endoplasmic reticulum protein 29